MEIGPTGFRLAEPLMRATRPGEGPDALRNGPPAWRASLLRSAYGGPTEVAGLPAPAERRREIRARLAAPGDPRGLLPLVERHIKAYCAYDADCDIGALARDLQGKNSTLLSNYAAELEQSWRDAPLRRLEDKRQSR